MKYLAFIILLLTAGCVTTPPIMTDRDADLAWQARQALLRQQQNWQLEGKLAVSLQEEGWQAGIHWQQIGDEFVIDLFDPLGRKVARFAGGVAGVTVTTSKGETASAADAESLMQDMLGFSLPVSGLRYWVLGLPDPQISDSERELDGAGRLSRLLQSGWVVDYQQYQVAGSTELPRKMTLNSLQLDAKLVIRDWVLSAP